MHDPNVKVGRIQNDSSWSQDMVPDPDKGSLGLEYFCFEGDGLWKSSDAELIALASRELQALRLATADQISGGYVVRQLKAYPIYDAAYKTAVAAVREEFGERFPTFHFVGRNGLHKYNNQDHAMMTAMLTVRNIIAGEKLFDVWNVNEDAEYHEEQSDHAAALNSVRLSRSRSDRRCSAATSPRACRACHRLRDRLAGAGPASRPVATRLGLRRLPDRRRGALFHIASLRLRARLATCAALAGVALFLATAWRCRGNGPGRGAGRPGARLGIHWPKIAAVVVSFFAVYLARKYSVFRNLATGANA